jgi:pyruvate dehydrogenase E2 component (dihydrolipoamide acetyltransferase)
MLRLRPTTGRVLRASVSARPASVAGASVRPLGVRARSMSSVSRSQPRNAQPRSTVVTVRAFSSLPAHQVLKMPSLSPTMTRGNIVEWKKKVGDKVSPGEVYCTVETDKATVDFESQEDGYLAKILIPGGTADVNVGTLVAVLADEAGDVAKFADFNPVRFDF